VNLQGLDLSSPAEAEKLVTRISVAAELACGTEAKHVPLRSDLFDRCYRGKVAAAIRAVGRPLVTQAYVERFPHEATMHDVQHRRSATRRRCQVAFSLGARRSPAWHPA
jgi:hypothetical protein